MHLLFFSGTCTAMPSPKKIAYKTFFELHIGLAITDLLLFLAAHILLLSFVTDSK